MDTFVEQIVAKKKGAKEIAVIAGTIFLIVVLVFVLFMFLGYFSLVIDMLLIYGAWWLITSQNIEYEYSVTNGDIDIDQIIAQRKRKPGGLGCGQQNRNRRAVPSRGVCGPAF